VVVPPAGDEAAARGGRGAARRRGRAAGAGPRRRGSRPLVTRPCLRRRPRARRDAEGGRRPPRRGPRGRAPVTLWYLGGPGSRHTFVTEPDPWTCPFPAGANSGLLSGNRGDPWSARDALVTEPDPRTRLERSDQGHQVTQCYLGGSGSRGDGSEVARSSPL